MLRQPLVGDQLVVSLTVAKSVLAKFTGYQYGGRPLGLTYAKYQNPGDAVEGQEETGGMTQDQIM